MRRGGVIALTALAIAAQSTAALAQLTPPAQCGAFSQLTAETQQKAAAVRNAIQKKVERKEICALVRRFYDAEEAVVKFLVNNKTWCGIPDQAIQAAKSNHERSAKFRTAACTETPEGKPRPPSLSDAIGTPSVDDASNTKTGRGTLDTLNGNPLAR